MSQQTRRFSAEAGVVAEMPGVYTAGPQMFNEIFNFPTGVELLGVPAVKEDGVASSKLNSNNSNWRGVSNGHQQQYDYSYGSFSNAQKEGNLNMQGLDAMQLYPANGGEYSGPAISFNSNSAIDRHQSSEINSMQFQIPGFAQSMANQGICTIEQVPSSVSWQSGAGLNELLLLPTGNNAHGTSLLNNNNHQFAAPQQLNNSANWGNNSVQTSSSQWCEQSPMETKLGEGFRRRDDRSVQGLSLSLSSNSQVQVQPFDTNRLIPSHDLVNRLQANPDVKNKSMDVLNASKVGLFSPLSRSEGLLSGKGYWNPNSGSSGQFTGYLKHSKYMKPTQQLLDEFCNVAGKGVKGKVPKQNNPKPERESYNISRSIAQMGQKVEPSVSRSVTSTVAGSGIISNDSMNGNLMNKDGPSFSGDRFELRRRKAKLLWMLDEVERRYRHYCDQMKMVVTSFESAAGVGAATTYTYLAAKAMSRHFKCLKDAILGQIRSTNELLGEKESSVPGITKGETPRLKLIEQSLRQQRTFHQVGMLEQDAWRPQRGLPERAVTVLRAWLFEHFLHPYPSDADKHLLARQTGLSRSQVSNWFINARVRLWKPMVEEMYQEEAREAEMKDQETNSNPNNHGKNEVGAIESNKSSKEFKHDMPLATHETSGGGISLTIESQDEIFDCSTLRASVRKGEGGASMMGTVESKNTIEIHDHQQNNNGSNKIDGGNSGAMDFSNYNANGSSTSGNLFHQQTMNSTYFGSGDVSLTLGLRHSGALSVSVADQEKYHNALYLP
ncbi:hypothetical protein SUGI_0433740 [Cryptomeria japonica]|uniref:BEL1-like homeodomain protein 4 n=1 Tax=Cryptomeria japonica TaxID=3369 RepID=UPI002408D607|nr:BEL1-like homeodomain protein 4 [Cryptomeria japonica]XP_059076015.1 BEL1-like homeodomain protein 4 [Cryptomeria japonica]GLJ22992.1 hypothetical protein SUGI_0433740 [Cryptomeria japonica]